MFCTSDEFCLPVEGCSQWLGTLAFGMLASVRWGGGGLVKPYPISQAADGVYGVPWRIHPNYHQSCENFWIAAAQVESSNSIGHIGRETLRHARQAEIRRIRRWLVDSLTFYEPRPCVGIESSLPYSFADAGGQGFHFGFSPTPSALQPFSIGRLFFYRGPHRDLKQVSSVRLRSQNKDEQGIYHFNPFHTCTIMYHHVPTCINLLRVNDSICDAALYSQNKATPIVRAMRSYRIETRRSRMRRSNSCPLLAPFSCRVVGLLQRTRCCHKFMERERERKKDISLYKCYIDMITCTWLVSIYEWDTFVTFTWVCLKMTS